MGWKLITFSNNFMPKIIWTVILICAQVIAYPQVNNLLHPFILKNDIDSISKPIMRQELSVPYAGLIFTWTNYSCVNSCSALPVQLLSFDAERKSESVVKVTWKTTNEVNNKKFVIQRSLGNTSVFKDVGWLAPDHLSTVTHYYSFLDSNDYENTSYYRLQQIDIDSGFSYSRIVAVNGNARLESISVYPSPATAEIWLNVKLKKPDKVIIDIYNSQGQRVYEHTGYSKKGNNLNNIGVAQFGQGVYFIKVVKSDGSILNTRFIKQH